MNKKSKITVLFYNPSWRTAMLMLTLQWQIIAGFCESLAHVPAGEQRFCGSSNNPFSSWRCCKLHQGKMTEAAPTWALVYSGMASAWNGARINSLGINCSCRVSWLGRDLEMSRRSSQNLRGSSNSAGDLHPCRVPGASSFYIPGNIKNGWGPWFEPCLMSNELGTLPVALRSWCILIRERIGNDLIICTALPEREWTTLCRWRWPSLAWSRAGSWWR